MSTTTDDSFESDPRAGANLLDPAFRDNPYPTLERVRVLDPFDPTPIGPVGNGGMGPISPSRAGALPVMLGS